MDFSIFVEEAIKKDKSNKFEKYVGSLDIVPNILKPFYSEYNPVNVEVEINDGIVRFYPVDALSELQHEYSYVNTNFVFATCNGDPIFFHKGKVYTCPHGVREPQWESLAESVDCFFNRENLQ